MARYRKKPVVINAFRLGTKHDGPASKLFQWMESFKEGWLSGSNNLDGSVTIATKEGDMTAEEGDYIIRGIHGEFYPCKPEIFEKTYERLDEQESE